jgi:hypothetical protein
MYRCVWVEFVGCGTVIPATSSHQRHKCWYYLYRHNFVHRVQLLWRSACTLQFMCLSPVVHLLPPRNPYWLLQAEFLSRGWRLPTKCRNSSYFVALWIILIFVLTRVPPFVPVLSHPPPLPTYLLKIIFNIFFPLTPRSFNCSFSPPNSVYIETAI